jgi:hypothetical protein
VNSIPSCLQRRFSGRLPLGVRLLELVCHDLLLDVVALCANPIQYAGKKQFS